MSLQETCKYCGIVFKEHGNIRTVDHFIPKVLGGANGGPNAIRHVCRKCNSLKGSKLPEEFLEYLIDLIELKKVFKRNFTDRELLYPTIIKNLPAIIEEKYKDRELLYRVKGSYKSKKDKKKEIKENSYHYKRMGVLQSIRQYENEEAEKSWIRHVEKNRMFSTDPLRSMETGPTFY